MRFILGNYYICVCFPKKHLILCNYWISTFKNQTMNIWHRFTGWGKAVWILFKIHIKISDMNNISTEFNITLLSIFSSSIFTTNRWCVYKAREVICLLNHVLQIVVYMQKSEVSNEISVSVITVWTWALTLWWTQLQVWSFSRH